MISISVRGSEAVERTLREVAPREALNLTRSTVGKIASEIMKDAKREMRFGGSFSTGNMKRATSKARRRVRQGIVQEDIGVKKRAFYWRFYEYGQGGNPRRAMFGKAVRKMNGNLARRFDQHFMKVLIARLARVNKRNAARMKRS